MRIVLFYHSLLSDWNHGNAHFLRGVAAELIARGHEVRVFEPLHSWSLRNLVQEHGYQPLEEFRRFFPHLCSEQYDPGALDLDGALDGADLVLVHEWNTPEIVSSIGKHRARNTSYRLLFHDTHHRMITDPASMSRFDLANYDGVLAFGRVIAELYLSRSLAARAWVWHEAADTRLFKPYPSVSRDGDLVWIGNWGDDERTRELAEFLFEPVQELGLNAHVYGVRYPDNARALLSRIGATYHGWVPNYKVPGIFSRFPATIHVPRRPYAESLPGIPTIRVFEALACGIPLVSAPWTDLENLFTPGEDYLVARDGKEMRSHLRSILHDPALAASLAERGRRTILDRHTCSHRADELLKIHCNLSIGIRRNQRAWA